LYPRRSRLSRVAATTSLRYNPSRRGSDHSCDLGWHAIPRNRFLVSSRPGWNVGRFAMSLIVSLLTIFGWASWGYVVLLVEPSTPVAPLAFYATLFVALTCTLAQLLGGHSSEGETNGGPSLGHGAAVTTVLLFALWLQSLGMLTPINGILLAATFILIQMGFRLNRDRGRPKARRRPRRASAAEAGVTAER